MPDADASGPAAGRGAEVRGGVIRVPHAESRPGPGGPPLRVVLLASSFDPYTGGVEEHARRVAGVLAGRGHGVEVWTVDRGEHLGVRTVDGFTVRYLPTPLPARSARDVVGFAALLPVAAWRWGAAWRAFRRARGSGPDVLHVQCFGPNGVYALALHRLTRVPLVVSSHGETFADDHGVFDASRLVPWALRSALGRAVAVTGCSRVVLDDLDRRFPGWEARAGATVSTVPNGVDLTEAGGPAPGATSDQDDAGPAAAHRGDGAPVVLAVGRLQRVKGFDLLVRAFAEAAATTLIADDVRLRIGGDGPEEGALRALADELGVGDRVDLPGRLDRRQVVAEMARATVVVVPSRAESFGITVLEAWRAGAPVVATTRGGPPEFVTDGGTGLLVDPTDTRALAAALGRLLADPDLRGRLGRAGAALVATEYSWERVADRYERLYVRPRKQLARTPSRPYAHGAPPTDRAPRPEPAGTDSDES